MVPTCQTFKSYPSFKLELSYRPHPSQLPPILGESFTCLSRLALHSLCLSLELLSNTPSWVPSWSNQADSSDCPAGLSPVLEHGQYLNATHSSTKVTVWKLKCSLSTRHTGREDYSKWSPQIHADSPAPWSRRGSQYTRGKAELS